MAKTTGGLLAKQNEQKQVVQQTKSESPLQALLSTKSIQARFEQMLGDNAGAFLSSVLTTVNDNKLLQNADPRTILASAAIAASLKLPVVKSLGKAYLVPYKGACSIQIGYKGLIALAQRSGCMKSIVAFPVYEGELKKWDKFTETFERGEKESDKVVGYYASFTLLNGFTKSTYWTEEEMTAHAKTYSQSYNSASSPWATARVQMGVKTALASIFKTYAPMSIEMEEAIINDGKVKTMDIAGNMNDVDIIEAETITDPEGRTVDTETGEILDADFSAEEIEASVGE